MAPYELTIIAYEATHLIDSTFETWMAATFAVTIFANVAGDSLNSSIKLFIAALYLCMRDRPVRAIRRIRATGVSLLYSVRKARYVYD
ncbi:MAG: hypothetical protein ACU84Q_10785 [Gammaproteobacteria bacterium]